MRSTQTVLVLAALSIAGCGDSKDDEDANNSPVADAGVNQAITSTSLVTLNGAGSYDPDGDPMTYHWALDAVPDGSGLMDTEAPFLVNDERDAVTSFTADVEGTYVVSLIVSDAFGASSKPDRMTVSVQSASRPVADAGTDQSTAVGAVVTLDGSASTDASDRELTYAWSVAQAPAHSAITSLTGADTVAPTLTPDTSGLYLIALVVNNGLEDSTADTVVVRAAATESDIPVAVAGDDIAGEDCTNIVLDGSGSYDPNDQPLTYLWDLESRPADSSATTDTFADRTASVTTFYPDTTGDYVVSLAVHDGAGWSVPDQTTISVTERDFNTPPAVNPGAGQDVAGGSAICEESAYDYVCNYCEAVTVTVGADAFVNDPDADTVSLLWTAESDGIAIHSPTSLETAVVFSGAAPSEPGACEPNVYTMRLTATDCTGASTSQLVTHIVNCCGYSSSDVVDTDSPS